MTAITLNLLAEEQLAEQARARDPVKVVVAAGLLLVALATAGGALTASFAAGKKAEVNSWRLRWETLQAAGLSQGTETYEALKTRADDYLAMNRTRVLYAPQLALVKSLIPNSVQLSRLVLTVATDVKQVEVDAAPGEGEGKPRRPARPQVHERLVLRLDGQAISTRPEIEVDSFLQALRANKAFSDQVEQIQLRSIAHVALGGDAAAGTTAAMFVIECQYKERK